MEYKTDIEKALECATEELRMCANMIYEAIHELFMYLKPAFDKISEMAKLSVETQDDNSRRKFAAIVCNGDRHGKELQERIYTNRRSWDYRPDKRRIHKASGIRKIR